jgi:hypothetical protein
VDFGDLGDVPRENDLTGMRGFDLFLDPEASLEANNGGMKIA